MAAAQSLRTTAGEGTLDLMLLNATHGVLIIADTVLNLPEIQAQCVHFQIIIVVSRENHFITYYRRTRLLTGPHEEDGRLWLQELKMKRPLVDILRPAEPTCNTRSTSQPPTHLVRYTTSNNVKLAILSNSPDQQQYEDSNTRTLRRRGDAYLNQRTKTMQGTSQASSRLTGQP